MPDVTRPNSGLGKRLFAWMCSHGMSGYERVVADRKAALFHDVSGRVLEIGAGPGPNLRYLPKQVEYFAVEPNPYFHDVLKHEGKRQGIHVEILEGSAERIPLPDASVDFVISTLVLCSVRDQNEVLAEVWRVLKPGGRFLFVEHVAATKDRFLRTIQNLWTPVHSRICDDCQLNRDTRMAIASNFASADIDDFETHMPLVSPHIMGRARK